jgi:hypothetical protein
VKENQRRLQINWKVNVFGLEMRQTPAIPTWTVDADNSNKILI